ncbi:hypothetical protein [Nostoc sp.]|uniref:hypothetical protein n=1 Tax=Nostoc sp. TaxID=1180 RepID=UPI002FFBD3B4
MNQAIEGVRWTIHDLEVLPENEWTRYEIINGELFGEKAQLVLVATLLGDDQITSPLLPGFCCSIGLFFPE